MIRRVGLIAAFAVASTTLLAADDHIVDADRTVDFSSIKTFAFRPPGVGVNKPEVNNPIVLGNVTSAIRTALSSKRLQESPDGADVTVEFSVSGQDYWVGPYGRAYPIDGRGRGARQPVAFTEGVLVVDVVARESGLLIWRGVYRDSEKDSAKFAQKLADDAKTLLAEYPPAKK